MKKFVVLGPLFCGILSLPGLARQDSQACGTHALTAREEMFLHRSSARRFTARAQAASANYDSGQIAIVEDSNGVVGRRNPFDLDQKTLSFVPGNAAASLYTFQVSAASYDPAASTSGSQVALNDDDTRAVALPFAFPYFGSVYRQIYLNSDGNLTFEQGDSASADRSLGRFMAGPPRIAPLYTDLDPSLSIQGVRISSDASRFSVSWAAVPAYNASGRGSPQTFQVRLYPDGRIEMTWSGINLTDAVVGISPGHAQGNAEILSFVTGGSQQSTAAIAERFSGSDAVDMVTAAQQFYRTHDDAYDYLVVFNSEGIGAGSGAVAYEVTARNSRIGYGDSVVDDGAQYGSARRLQSVLNMGPLSQYPSDPNAAVPSRGITGDTTLTVLGHEAGHLFLAFASVPDPNDPKGKPMLGRSLVHWSFLFNSEASLLEGNRIQDNGPSVSRRFATIATVEGYAPLDQYLMGFRAPDEVPPTFLVSNPNPATDAARAPQRGVSFDGQRRDISIGDVIDAVGRRTPDSTVAQRAFRFAFLLVVPAGTQPTATDLAKIESYRAGFEAAYARFTSNRATADASLKLALQLSAAPASGVLAGGTGTATITLDHPASGALTVLLRSDAGLLGLPSSVTIADGASSVSFVMAGMRVGLDSLTAEPSNPAYETVSARIQVSASPGALGLSIVSGANQAAVAGKPLSEAVGVRVSDVNQLPYSGVPVQASAMGGGLVNSSAVTDANGVARFQWIPGTGANELTLSLSGGASVKVVALGLPQISAGAVVNAASFAGGISPGSIATLFGLNLTGATVRVNGQAAQVLYSDLRQLNFVVPASVTGDTAAIALENVAGPGAAITVAVTPIQPGLFAAVNRGSYAEIYGTGLLGVTAPKVTISGQDAVVLYSGAAPGFAGLFQINAAVPGGTGTGAAVVVTAGGLQSNPVVLR